MELLTSGTGGLVTIRKNATDPLPDPYEVPEWSESDVAYKVDQVVFTQATTAGKDLTYWVATQDHDSVAGDVAAAATGDDAVQLKTAKWDKLPLGTIPELISWALNRSTTQRTFKLLREKTPRARYGVGVQTLTLVAAYNFVGNVLQQVLREPNETVYVQVMPQGPGTGLEVIEGYFRTGESDDGSGDGETEMQFNVELASAGTVTRRKQD